MTERYQKIRQHSIALCAPLQKEDYVVQPVADVSPPKWHLAHTTWFFEEMILSKYWPDYERFHPRYAFLFNSYYNSIGDRVLRPMRGNMSRPTVDEIMAYRIHVDKAMALLMKHCSADVNTLIEIGLNHEQQHQELLLTDIKYILGHNPLFPPYLDSFQESIEGGNDPGFISMEEGNYVIGHEGNGFSFDNEGKQHTVFLHPFEISSSLVTNAEYLEFMEDGGYADPRFWHSDGWAWVQQTQTDRPMYWHKIDHQWRRYSLAGLQTLPLNEPITHISLYEAAAFAEWKSMRLPTEFEWEAASDHFSWGQRWEHTNSAYLPYPGYTKPAGALGEYNGKFMINQMVLRGASIATPDGHSRKTYRNFFPPHLQWQFTGIRLCKK